MEIFDINGEDISRLNDKQLRDLIGLLCETEFSSSNLSPHGIYWGGNQDAPDGGADVLVESNELPKTEFIPSNFIVFQVKKPSMPASKIRNEMRPNGNLKPVISEAISKKGAYIIISSSDNTSHSAWKTRIECMKEMIDEEEDSESLTVDFLDQSRVATWVRCFPPMVIWVRDKIERNIQGWKPLGNWSYMSSQGQYLFDKALKVKNGKNDQQSKCALDGINEIRNILRQERTSVRLTGLSGVGKTRFSQALFEEKEGGKLLDKTKVIYTDVSFNPNPSPVSMAEHLLSAQKRAFLIIDNCLPQLHNQLTQICRQDSSKISLLTIEYDVRDDLPDETSVFILEPSSDELIEQLINNKFTHLKNGISRQISRLSGGNSRLALALAHTFDKTGTTSDLKDEELFERLFYQGDRTINENLLKVACICSLVYSFDGQDIKERSELGIISKLSSLDILRVYELVSDLKSRDLIQTRNHWRALLPHALANRLAKRAFDYLPEEYINTTLLESSNKRVVKSFSRRLSYLYDFQPVKNIAAGWLDGWLSNPSQHDEYKNEVFINIAPIDQEKTLKFLETSVESLILNSNAHFNDHIRIVRSLAYEEIFFERSVILMVKMVISNRQKEYEDHDNDQLIRLFQPFLSGTLAKPETRLNIIDKLLKSSDTNIQKLGLKMVKVGLQTPPFAGAVHYDFGSRPRNYGYNPNRKELKEWYTSFVNNVMEFDGENSLVLELKEVFGKALSPLIAYYGCHNELIGLIKVYNGKKYWFEGWVAINRFLDLYGDKANTELKENYRSLRDELAPKNLLERIMAYVLSTDNIHSSELYDLDNSISATEKHERLNELAIDLGMQVHPINLIDEFEDSIISDQGRGLYYFGIGLSKSPSPRPEIWVRIKMFATRAKENLFTLRTLNGFMHGAYKEDEQWADMCLNEMISIPSLKRFYVSAECAVGLTEHSKDRILKAIKDLEVPNKSFMQLAYGRSHEPLSDVDFCEILKSIFKDRQDKDVGFELIKMRIHGSRTTSAILKKFGKSILLEQLPDVATDGRYDYDLSVLVKKCLSPESDSEAIELIARKERLNHVGKYFLRYENTEFLNALAQKAPSSFLNGFLIDADGTIINISQDKFSYSKNPLDGIPEPVLLHWISINPQVRFPVILNLINGYVINDKKETDWVPIAYASLSQSYDLAETFKALEFSLINHSSITREGNDYNLRIELFSKLADNSNVKISNWAAKNVEYLIELQRKEIERQNELSRLKDQSFE